MAAKILEKISTALSGSSGTNVAVSAARVMNIFRKLKLTGADPWTRDVTIMLVREITDMMVTAKSFRRMLLAELP